MWQQRAVVLRPLGVGERIDAAIKIVRRSLLTFVKAAMVIAIPAAIIDGAISLSIFSAVQTAQPVINSNGLVTVNNVTSSLQTIFGGLAALEFVTLVAGALITAIAVRVVADAYLGHPSNWRQALGYGARRFGSVLWIQLLILLAIGVPAAVVGVVVALLANLGSGGAVLGVLLGLVAVVGVIWFWVSASLAVPVLMTENIRGWKAVRRSVGLCRKNWWSTFGTLLLAFLLLLIGTTILRLLIDFVIGLAGGGNVVLAIEGAVVSLLTTMLFVSFVAAVQVVIAIDLRVRKEGFDIQLLASQMGVAPTASALSFLSPPPGAQGWGYGGYPAPGYGGYPPPPGGYPPGGGPAAPPPGVGYGSPQPGGAPPAPGGWESVAPGWSQPVPPGQYPGYPPGQYPPPWNQQPPAYPPPPGQPPMPPAYPPPYPSPTPDRPLPPFQPRNAEPPGTSTPEQPPKSEGEGLTEPLPPEPPPEAGPGESAGS